MLSKIPEPFPRGKVYYFWYYDDSGKRKAKSTGQTTKKAARQFIKDFLADLEDPQSRNTLREYSQDFFTERCPHMNRVGRTFSPTHIRQSRSHLVNHIWKDEIANRPISAIRRADIMDFLIRVRKNLGDKENTAEKILQTIKTIFNEAELREDILRNPTRKVNMQYTKKERGAFTLQELQAMFKQRPGVWGDDIGYMVFYIAAATGMRSGEIRALSWPQINFSAGTILINQAWKDAHTLGLPKWDKIREIPVSGKVLALLQEVKKLSSDNDFLFKSRNSHLGYTWWRKHFVHAMEEMEIDTTQRTITAHSLRHTLNSVLLETGVDNLLVQKYLGWTSRDGVTPTQRGYTHLSVNSLRAVSRKIDKLLP